MPHDSEKPGANIDRRACHLQMRLYYRSPIDLRASTSFRIIKSLLTLSAQMPVSSSDGSDGAKRSGTFSNKHLEDIKGELLA